MTTRLHITRGWNKSRIRVTASVQVMGMRCLTAEEYSDWRRVFDEANLTMGGGNARLQKVREEWGHS